MTSNEEQSILLAMDHDCHNSPEGGCEWCYDIALGNIRVCGLCGNERGGTVKINDMPWLWNTDNMKRKTEIVKKCGWVIKFGELSRLGTSIVGSSWEDLSPAVQNVIFNFTNREMR